MWLKKDTINPIESSEAVDYFFKSMNAFEAAKKNGKALELQNELETMFVSQNKSLDKNTTDITATFL